MNPKRGRRLAIAAVAGVLGVGGLFAAPPAQSTGPCGYVRVFVPTNTSVPVGAYCNNADHPRCEPGIPVVGPGSFIVGDYFFCMDWPPD